MAVGRKDMRRRSKLFSVWFGAGFLHFVYNNRASVIGSKAGHDSDKTRHNVATGPLGVALPFQCVAPVFGSHYGWYGGWINTEVDPAR